MIRLATQEDRTTIERLCAKEPWDGTEVMTAHLSRCADTAQVDWQYSDLWVGQSQTQKQNAQYLLCRIGQTYRIIGFPRSRSAGRSCITFCRCSLRGNWQARQS